MIHAVDWSLPVYVLDNHGDILVFIFLQTDGVELPEI
jgi:hypothetical protein